MDAFKNRNTKNGLPFSISDLWKADLFVGHSDAERWVGTTVKVNAALLEGAQGLRIGIIPARVGVRFFDRVRMDEMKNLVICPLLHDGDFMQKFYEGCTDCTGVPGVRCTRTNSGYAATARPQGGGKNACR